jgi:hypothetical protein
MIHIYWLSHTETDNSEGVSPIFSISMHDLLYAIIEKKMHISLLDSAYDTNLVPFWKISEFDEDATCALGCLFHSWQYYVNDLKPIGRIKYDYTHTGLWYITACLFRIEKILKGINHEIKNPDKWYLKEKNRKDFFPKGSDSFLAFLDETTKNA